MLGITAVRTRGTFLRRTVRKYFLRTNTFKKYVLTTPKNTQGATFDQKIFNGVKIATAQSMQKN